MGYYTRVFCGADKFPALSEIETYLHSLNPLYRVEAEVDDNNNYWTNFELYYKEEKHPIPVDLNWCEEDDSLGKDELNEFLDGIGSLGLSLKKRSVIKKLKKTKFIICNQLLSDLDEDGYFVNGRLMQFFVERYDGMIHADNEGFYDRNGILLLKS